MNGAAEERVDGFTVYEDSCTAVQPLASHLNWMRSQGYTPNRVQIILPHDGSAHDKVYDVSYESAFRDAGYDVLVIPNHRLRNLAVNAVKQQRTSSAVPALGVLYQLQSNRKHILGLLRQFALERVCQHPVALAGVLIAFGRSCHLKSIPSYGLP